jgi:phosphatidylserine decarboxylase
MLAVNSEVYSSLIAVGVAAVAILFLARFFAKSWSGPILIAINLAVIGSAYMLYFFRDPERLTPDDPRYLMAGADGKIMSVKHVFEPKHLQTNAVRISIFLSLTDVHVNRAPITGSISYARYFPGARYFTFLEKSSDFNQHSEIVIQNERTTCLVNQIVGPIARRVVYWVHAGQRIQAGQRIGMMKFGSRLDIYIPEADVEKILVREKQKVRAGETILVVLKDKPAAPGGADAAPATAPAPISIPAPVTAPAPTPAGVPAT